MKKDVDLNKENDFFSAKEIDDVIILSLNKNLLIRSTDLTERDRVLDFLDSISRSDTIKVVVILSSPEKSGSEEYIDFYRKVLDSRLDRLAVYRMLNVFNQIILRIAGLNKVVVHSNSGLAIPLFLNISLACDYRIVADNTVFQKPYLKLGMVPTGGGAFFLSMIRVLNQVQGTIAAFSTRIGGVSFASAGMICRVGEREGFRAISSSVVSYDRHPITLPDACECMVKLCFSPRSGIIMGGQVYGCAAVGELINVIALAIQKRVTVREIDMMQIATHPLLTAAPTVHPFINAAHQGLAKMRAQVKQ